MVRIPSASLRALAQQHVERDSEGVSPAACVIRARVRKAPAGVRSKTTCLQLVVGERAGGGRLPDARSEFVVRWGDGRAASSWRMTVGRSPGNPVWFHNRIRPHDGAALEVEASGAPVSAAALIEQHGYGVGDAVELRPGTGSATFVIRSASGRRAADSGLAGCGGRIDVHRDHSLQVPRITPRVGRRLLAQAPTWIRRYNRGTFLGRANPDLDAEGYERFAAGPARDMDTLVDDLAFVGRFYGGTKESLLPDGSWSAEARRIAGAMLSDGRRYRRVIRATPPLDIEVPSVQATSLLLAPFHASRSWMVWGSKVLHFLAPATFPQLDAEVEAMLGLRRRSYEAHYYVGFMDAYRQVLEQFADDLQQLRAVDAGSGGRGLPVGDVKILDKVLYEAARERRRRRR